MRVSQVRDIQGAAHTVKLIRTALVVFGLLEVGENVGIAPACIAQPDPFVEIFSMPAGMRERGVSFADEVLGKLPTNGVKESWRDEPARNASQEGWTEENYDQDADEPAA